MSQMTYRWVEADGLSIFYREAGPRAAPTILLLHGFPSSSRMYGPLLARLADRYHLIAPDYPGFGHSDAPDSRTFASTFDHLAQVVGRFTAALGLARYSMYLQDYGGPVGFRLALRIPSASKRSSSRTPSRTRMGSARYGRPAAPSGPTVRRTRRRCARTSSRSPRPAGAISVRARAPRPTTPISGPTSSPS